MIHKSKIGKSVLGFCLAVVAIPTLHAANKEQRRLENSGVVMQEIMGTPENIPQEILEKAECVIVFPSVLKAAFVVGGSYGRGAMVCRTGKNFRGPWGATRQCMRLRAAALDFKIGGQATDLVLLVMNERGASTILGGKWPKFGSRCLDCGRTRWGVTRLRTPTLTCGRRF